MNYGFRDSSREGVGAGIYRGDGVEGKELPRHRSASPPSTTVG
jgi:hypothetical protein